MKLITIITSILWAAMALANNQLLPNEPVAIHAIAIELDGLRQRDHNFEYWNKLVRDIITIRRGDQLTQKKLSSAVSALKAFGQVQTTVRPLDRGVTLNFLIQPYQRIKSIRMKGVYPLFQRDIRNLMTIAPGNIFDSEKVKAQAKLITQRYRSEGYIDPKVNITWEQDQASGHIHITIQIQKGDAYTLGKLKLTGNKAISDTIIKSRMSTWRSSAVWLGTSRLVMFRLPQDIQKLIAYYRQQKFADIRIDHRVDPRPKQRKADITLTIDEGSRYEIEFVGNHYFSNHQLKNDLILFAKGNRGNTGLRRTVQNIRRRYIEAGFVGTRIQWRKTNVKNIPTTKRKVRINIQEGRQRTVHRVTFAGNYALDTETIQAQMLTRPSHGLKNGVFIASVLQEDIDAIKELYHQNGYLNVLVANTVITDPDTQQVTVDLSIEEGAQTLVGKMKIEAPAHITAYGESTDLPLKSGDIFQSQIATEGENVLSSRIAAKGFPHIQVKTRVKFSENRTRADIIYNITPGPLVKTGRIFWAGNFRTKNARLRRELNLEEGHPFSLARVLDAQRRLRNMDLFQSVQIRSIGLKEKAPKVHLLVTLVEKSSYFFELGTGFRTDKGPYGRTKIGDRNFLGLNKEIRIGGEISGIGYRWDAEIIESRLLGSDISANLGFFTERREEFNQDFGVDTSGGNLTFSRPWGKRITTALGIRYERRQQYLKEKKGIPPEIDPETLEPRTIWVSTPAIRYDSRDSFVRPSKGNFASLAADLSKGLDNSLDDFIKYKMDLRTYFKLTHRLTIAGRTLAGYIQPYNVDERNNDDDPNNDGDRIPEDQLFFMGGTTDVRGFGENLLRFNDKNDPVGGRMALAASIEGRYALTENWELTLFIDGGSIQIVPSDKKESDNRWQWATGCGLRYITPIGPIGLLYGHKIDPRPGESDGQLHFSIGYTF